MIINAKRVGLALSGAAIAVAVPLGIAQSAQAHGGGPGHPFQGPSRSQHTDTVDPTTSGEPTTSGTPTTSKTPCTHTTTSSPTTSATTTDTATDTATAQANASVAKKRGGHRR